MRDWCFSERRVAMRRCTNMPEVVADDVRYCGKSGLERGLLSFRLSLTACRRLRRALWRLKNAEPYRLAIAPTPAINVPCTAFAPTLVLGIRRQPNRIRHSAIRANEDRRRPPMADKVRKGCVIHFRRQVLLLSERPGHELCQLRHVRVYTTMPRKGTAGQVLRGPRWPKGEPRPR